MPASSRQIKLDALNAINAGTIIIDNDCRIIFWNEWMATHSRLSAEEVINSSLEQVFPDVELGHLNTAIQGALDSRQSDEIPRTSHPSLLPLYPEGETPSRIKQSIVIKPMHLDGEECYCLIEISDISSPYKNEQSLLKQNAELLSQATEHKNNEAHARAIIENINNALVTVDQNNYIVDFNNTAHKLFGYEDSEILGHQIEELFDSAEKEQFTYDQYYEVDCKNNLGQIFPAEAVCSSVKTNHASHSIWIIRDISLQKQAEETLYREKEFAQITLESIQEAVLTTDENGIINSANPAACTLLHKDLDKIIDRPLLNIITFHSVEERQDLRTVLHNTLTQGQSSNIGNYPKLIFDDGEAVIIKGRINALSSTAKQAIGSVVVLQDVTLAHRMKEILSYQASHDELTSLINRREFERRLEDSIFRANSDDINSVLLYLDLDQFKLINDTCGHDAGDLLLRQLTGLLRTRLRKNDTLARLGGDEFAALLPGCDLGIGNRIAEEMRQTVNEYRFNWKGRNLSVGVSIGLVMVDDSHDRVATLLKAADSACYIAKEAGRNQVVVYQADGNEEMRRHHEMSQAALIRDSLEKNRFRLHCQPIVSTDMLSNPKWGIEILIRMIDSAGEIVPPMAFIPAAERYNLMMHIDRWVLDSVCEQWVKNSALFERLDKCTINLSGQSIANEEFLEHVISRIQNAKLPWEKICFEITETAAVASIEKAQHFMNVLSRLGCRFALDDFGSGLSSFTYLKHLPVDFLKIDGAFVKDMLNDKIDAAIVRSISEVGKAMELMTIAEFVEDTEVIKALKEAHVDYAQGYGICRPIPLEELDSFTPQIY